MYSNIIVPLDGSELAEEVLPYVKDLVARRTSTVHLISIAPLEVTIPAPAVPARLYPAVMRQADLELHVHDRARIEAELTEYLRGIALDLAQGKVVTHIEVHFGEAAETILAYAEAVHADLIAMCTHGRTGLARWAYGSVTEKVMHHAPCPVLLVRTKKAGGPLNRP